MRPMMIVAFWAFVVGFGPAMASDIDFGHVIIKKDPFKDLPGVKEDDSKSLKSKAACKPHTANIRLPPPNVSMPVLVYDCQEGNMTFESNLPPLEHDWEIYKKRQ
jgi:hypothetical protein